MNMSGNQDLIEELKKAAAGGNCNLRKTKKPQAEGQVTMLYSFGSSSSSQNKSMPYVVFYGQTFIRQAIKFEYNHILCTIKPAYKVRPIELKSGLYVQVVFTIRLNYNG